MKVRSLAPFGVAVSGLTGETLTAQRDAIAALLHDHGFVVIEGANLDADAHMQLIGFVGPLLDEGGAGDFHSFISHDPQNLLPEAFEVLMSGPLAFHSDLTYTAVPPEVLSLQALILPGSGGATRFASGVRALETLPPELRAQIEGRMSRHVFSYADGYITDRYREAQFPGRYFAADHPLVFRNQRTGRDVLFATQLSTDRVLDVDPADSERLLQALFAHLYAPGNVYVHEWQLGDLVMWENVEVQHSRSNYDPRERRLLRRVIAGDHESHARHAKETEAQRAGIPGEATFV